MSRHQRKPRRSSTIGLLAVDEDDATFGDNNNNNTTNKYAKNKGSFLSGMKQKVGQKVQTAKLNLNSGVNMFVSSSGHYSVDKQQDFDGDSDMWDSDGDFTGDDDNITNRERHQLNSSFDRGSFDFGDAFGGDKSKLNTINDNQESQLEARPGPVQRSNSLDKDHEGAADAADDDKAVSTDKRKSNGNLLSRRLEDNNLTKIKYGDEASILQFSPLLAWGAAAPAKKEKDPLSKSHHDLSLDPTSEHTNSKKKGRKKGHRRTNSLPSEKILRRAQRRNRRASSDVAPGSSSKDVTASIERPNVIKRSKSSDDTPFDMSEEIDLFALRESLEKDTTRKSKKKGRGSKSPKRSSNNTSSLSKRDSRKGSKKDKAATTEPISSAEFTPNTLDVKF